MRTCLGTIPSEARSKVLKVAVAMYRQTDELVEAYFDEMGEIGIASFEKETRDLMEEEIKTLKA